MTSNDADLSLRIFLAIYVDSWQRLPFDLGGGLSLLVL